MSLASVEEVAERLVDQHVVKAPMLSIDWIAMPFYPWLSLVVDVGIVSTLLYTVSSILCCVRQSEPHAFSTYALFTASVAPTMTLLQNMVRNGFLHQESILSVAVGLVATMLALGATQLPEWAVDFQLEAGVSDASERVNALLRAVVDPEYRYAGIGPSSIYLLLAFVAGGLSMVTFLSTLWFSRAYQYLVNEIALPKWQRWVLTGAFFAPLALSLLWLRPIVADSFLPRDLVKCSTDSVARDCTVVEPEGFYLTESSWLAIRVRLVAAYAAVMVAITPWLVQAYLRRARGQQVELLVNMTEDPSAKRAPAEAVAQRLQAISRSHITSAPLAAFHGVAVPVLLMMLAFLFIRHGSLPVSACSAYHAGMKTLGLDPTWLHVGTDRKRAVMDEMLSSAIQFYFPGLAGVHGSALTSPLLWRPVFSFLLWWICTSWFVCSALGLLYWDLANIARRSIWEDKEVAPAPEAAEETSRKGKGRGKKKTKGE